MPALGKYQRLLKTVFYLYPDVESAKAGKGFGATGFFCTVPLLSRPEMGLWLGVTNWHAAVRDGNSVVRVNRADGGVDVFGYEPHEWFFLPGRNDIAVLPLDVGGTIHDIRGIASDRMFLTKEVNKGVEIDVGDDVFMVGRFIDYDGIEANKPAVRFGNISIMCAPVQQPTGYRGESIVVDMHSRTGFSGSPVFVYRTSGALFGEIPDGNLDVAEMWVGHTMHFLGLHWGQFPEAWELKDEERLDEARRDPALITDGKYIKGMSGMSCVLPPDAILEVLEMPALKKVLAEREKIALRGLKGAPVAESVAPAATDKNPDHREDFGRLVGLAAKAKPDK